MTTIPMVDRLRDALGRRLAATTLSEKREAEDEIADILRGKPAAEPFDAKKAQAGRDE